MTFNNPKGFYSPERDKWVVTDRSNIGEHPTKGHSVLIDEEAALFFDNAAEMKPHLFTSH